MARRRITLRYKKTRRKKVTENHYKMNFEWKWLPDFIDVIYERDSSRGEQAPEYVVLTFEGNEQRPTYYKLYTE